MSTRVSQNGRENRFEVPGTSPKEAQAQQQQIINADNQKKGAVGGGVSMGLKVGGTIASLVPGGGAVGGALQMGAAGADGITAGVQETDGPTKGVRIGASAIAFTGGAQEAGLIGGGGEAAGEAAKNDPADVAMLQGASGTKAEPAGLIGFDRGVDAPKVGKADLTGPTGSEPAKAKLEAHASELGRAPKTGAPKPGPSRTLDVGKSGGSTAHA